MPAEPCGAADTGPTDVGPRSAQRVSGQVRREMRADGDRADTGAAATVRDAERLVQVQVRHVGAEPTRLGEPEQRVEVGTVDVHLAAGVVDRARRARRSTVS